MTDLESAAASAAPEPLNNMIAVASGKGGVGKTWFSVTLAHALAVKGKKILLFDGDLGMANVDIQLGLMPKRDLGDVIMGRANLADVVVRYRDEADRSEFDIIAGRSGSASLASLPVSKIHALRADLALLSKDYDFVIIDLGAGIDQIVRQFIAEASHGIIVTTQEPTALTDAYAFIKMTLRDHPEADMQVVINQALTIRDGGNVYLTLRKAVEEFLKIRINLLGIVRHDRKVSESIRYQSPILTRYPACRTASDVEEIAARIIKSFNEQSGLNVKRA